MFAHNYGTIRDRGVEIRSPIDSPHPAEVEFGFKSLSDHQQTILGQLPGYGSRIVIKKRDVSMMDLSALTAETGDEFAMFTRKGERLIIRGDAEQIPLYENDIIKLRDEGYRWSGHTHPGITDADLIASQGDKDALRLFGQDNSVIYNAAGRHGFIK